MTTWNELTEAEQLLNNYSDDYKDKFGFRPRGLTPEQLASVEWLKDAIDGLGDFNEDGNVNGDDLADWDAGFGSTPATHMTGDANKDAAANGFDFLAWQEQHGNSGGVAGDATVVPEPTTTALALVGFPRSMIQGL